jgi:Flp pilus assembly pilin Flp
VGPQWRSSERKTRAMDRLRHAEPNRDDHGATSTEYALLISMIALFIIGSLAAVGTNLAGVYDRSCDEVATVSGGTDC